MPRFPAFIWEPARPKATAKATVLRLVKQEEARQEAPQAPPQAPAVAAPPTITVRRLPPEEWQRLLKVPPFDAGVPLTISPGVDKVIVLEDPSGKIVGYWMAFLAVHLEPMWIDPEHRGRVSVNRKIWREARAAVLEFGTNIAFALINADSPAARYAERLGFRRTIGDCYFVTAGNTPPELERLIELYARQALKGE